MMPPRRYLPTESFIVEWWSRLFRLSHYLSPHRWLQKLVPRIGRSYRFVDSWVIGHFLASIFLFVVTVPGRLSWVERLSVFYGGIIVVEGFFYEIDVLVFSGYETAKKGIWQRVLSYRRLVVTSLQNYAAIIFWFALFYRHWSSGFTPVPPALGADAMPVDPWLTWLTLSLHTMTTFGSPSMAPIETWTLALTLAQSSIGLLMALLIVVSFVRLLPEPGSKTRFEQQPPPYHPIYDPGKTSDVRCSGRSRLVSSISKESLPLAAAVGAFALSGLSLMLGYLLLAAEEAYTSLWICTKCLGGFTFMVIGVSLAIFGLFSLWRRSAPHKPQHADTKPSPTTAEKN